MVNFNDCGRMSYIEMTYYTQNSTTKTYSWPNNIIEIHSTYQI